MIGVTTDVETVKKVKAELAIAKNMREMLKKYSCEAIAERYGLCRETVQSISSGRRHKGVKTEKN